MVNWSFNRFLPGVHGPRIYPTRDYALKGGMQAGVCKVGGYATLRVDKGHGCWKEIECKILKNKACRKFFVSCENLTVFGFCKLTKNLNN